MGIYFSICSLLKDNNICLYFICNGFISKQRPNIFIFILLARNFYNAGQTVLRSLIVLTANFSGKEKIKWAQYYDNGKEQYSNKRLTYQKEFALSKFNNGIEVDHYSFPFSLLLPSTFHASFKFTQSDNYNRYFISTYLPPFDAESSVQAQQIALQIREPCRLLQQPFSLRETSKTKCCGCCCCSRYCCVCGTAQLTLQSDTPSLFRNRLFGVRALVDNRAGKTTINSVKIVLKESVRRISKTQKAFDLGQEIVLRQFPIEVPIGSSMPLQDKIMIPASVLGYTAIGNIISRAYFLELVANVNCCYSDLRASRHVIVNNDIDPPFQQQNNKKAPFNWNPKIGDSVYFLNLQPYDYNPCASIGALNQSGASNHMIGIANYLSGEVTY